MYEYDFTFTKNLLEEKNEAAQPELCANDTTVISRPNIILFAHLIATTVTKDDLLLIADNIGASQSDVSNINNL